MHELSVSSRLTLPPPIASLLWLCLLCLLCLLLFNVLLRQLWPGVGDLNSEHVHTGTTYGNSKRNKMDFDPVNLGLI